MKVYEGWRNQYTKLETGKQAKAARGECIRCAAGLHGSQTIYCIPCRGDKIREDKKATNKRARARKEALKP